MFGTWGSASSIFDVDNEVDIWACSGQPKDKSALPCCMNDFEHIVMIRKSKIVKCPALLMMLLLTNGSGYEFLRAEMKYVCAI
jgi:hypothetical protein